MVKVALLNAELPLAGEIIRILVTHPETEIQALHSPLLAGRNVSSIHHGLIGEQQFNFTDKLNLEELQLVIILKRSDLSDKIISQAPNFEDLKIITLGKDFFDASGLRAELGVSEINRKALVRGAKMAYIISPIISPALIALGPLAGYLLLNADLEIEVKAPVDIVKESDAAKLGKEMAAILSGIQSSFHEKVDLKLSPLDDEERGITTKISLKNNLSIEEIEKIYDQIYDDHNFTFISRSDIGMEEVIGTQKSIIFLDKPTPETLVIKVVADARMRGGAGDAVHILNLFFGLHEKTGLNLKPACYSQKNNKRFP